MGTLDPPRERVCLRCDRREVWDDDQSGWVAKRVDGDKQRGTPHCVHEWDITGNYSPLENET